MPRQVGRDDGNARSEKDLKASVEARLAQLLAASPAVIYSFAAEGTFAPTYVSDNISRLFGYEPSDYLKDPDFWRGRVHPEDLAQAEAEVGKLFDCGKAVVEYRFRKADGSYVWVSDKQLLRRDEAGRPIEVVGSWSDISDRKAAQAAEDALKARLELLLESAPAVIYAFKAKGDFCPTFISENVKRLLGYCPDEYLKHADFWRTHVHPDDLETVEVEQAKLFKGGRHTTEYRFRKKDGSYVWLADEQHLIRDEAGEAVEIVGSWSDITTRRKAEQRESAAQARFALMLNSAPAVVYSFKAQGDYRPTFVSENIQRVLGYEPEEYLAHADFWRERMHPEDRPAVEASRNDLFKTGRNVAEYRFRKKDGAYVWIADEQHVLRDHAGRPVEVIGSWSEVTERKEAEQAALQESEQRLADAIESITEGFTLYDDEDRLVTANSKYREIFSLDEAPEPGTSYEEMLRQGLARGIIGETNIDPEKWLNERMARHRNPGDPVVAHLPDGRWLRIGERRTSCDGTVAIYSDITAIKENERKAAAANQLIMQSLRYASRIQAAILPAARELSVVAADHFLIWEPRDIVGGDFFWFQPIAKGYAVIVGDCTGHGVPGAFMTLIAWGLLERMLSATPSSDPSMLLTGLHRGVQALLGQDREDGETDDGLEAGVCFVNTEERKMHFSGARFSLWRANEGKVKEIKGDRKGVGYRRYPADTRYSNFHLDLDDNDSFYMTTDGFIEQIGGPRGRSFGKNRFQTLLKETSGYPMAEQAQILKRAIETYQGDQVRRDDLTVLGFVPRMQ